MPAFPLLTPIQNPTPSGTGGAKTRDQEKRIRPGSTTSTPTAQTWSTTISSRTSQPRSSIRKNGLTFSQTLARNTLCRSRSIMMATLCLICRQMSPTGRVWLLRRTAICFKRSSMLPMSISLIYTRALTTHCLNGSIRTTKNTASLNGKFT